MAGTFRDAAGNPKKMAGTFRDAVGTFRGARGCHKPQGAKYGWHHPGMVMAGIVGDRWWSAVEEERGAVD